MRREGYRITTLSFFLTFRRMKEHCFLAFAIPSLVKETPSSAKGKDHECIFTPE